jgi:hypothetical protein
MSFFDPRHQSWENWRALMCEEHAEHGLPINAPESEWKEWGQRFIQLAEHAAGNSLPDPRAFPTWQEWAQALLINDLEPL